MSAVLTKKPDVLTIDQWNREEITDLLKQAYTFQKTPPEPLLKGKILATCFFEPSTRTRLSFESAMYRLGGNVLGFSEQNNTSVKKGESLSDSIRVIGEYADALVIRHPLEGSAKVAAEATDIPVINGGDGTHEHPTQTLIDLYTIWQTHGRLEELSVAIVGDLKYGRSVHSLAKASALFGIRLYFISPPDLELPSQMCDALKRKGALFSFHREIEEVIHKVDILYMTRLQKERNGDKGTTPYTLTPPLLKKARSEMKILHPLPRVDEIDPAIDSSSHAAYFTQSKNGVAVRQAILNSCLQGDA